MNSKKGYALVTGASSGIGTVYADRLARRGYDLILVARRQDRLRAVAESLIKKTGRQVQTISADLTRPGPLGNIEEVLRVDNEITLLVNNAGVASNASILEADVDKMSAMIALNVNALTRLSYAAAPRFVERGNGAIINIASIVGIAPEFLNGVYGATKAYVYAFSQKLKQELADKGVRLQVVLPGVTVSELWDNFGASLDDLPKDMIMTTDDMVDAALAGFDQGEFATIPSLPEIADFNAYETARQALMPNLSKSQPAARYRE